MVSPIYQGYGSRLDRRDQKMGDGFKIFWFSQNMYLNFTGHCVHANWNKEIKHKA